jgi:outer membrane receptor for ferrienterochelin and colicin
MNLPIGINIQNPGDAEIQGIEWSTQLHVNELMSLGFNTNYTDTEFTKASLDPQIVLVGDPIDNIPKYSYSINADFDFNWSSSTAGFAHINFNRQGPSTVTNRSFTPLILESSDLNLLNAQIGAEWQQLTVRVFGRNLTNELRAINQSLFSELTQNRPRTLGVSFTYDF